MSSDEVVYLLFGLRVPVLELVQRDVLLHVESVGRDEVGLPLQQMLRLEARDVGHSGEDVGTVHGRSLDAVAVIDAAITSLLVYVKLVK